MTMDQAAVWLSASVLVMLGLIVVSIGLVAVNRILHKYWKPVKFFSQDSFTLFGGHSHTNDPLNTITQEEYNELIAHLEKIRFSLPKTK